MAYAWETVLGRNQNSLHPDEHDWETDGNGNIKIKWTTKAPSILQDPTNCRTFFLSLFGYIKK